MMLTKSGTDRYDQLPGFNNTSDGATSGSGMTDFSPVGLPILNSRASVPAGMFGQAGAGDAQSASASSGGSGASDSEPGFWSFFWDDLADSAEARLGAIVNAGEQAVFTIADVVIRLDPPHFGTDWDVPHLNIGSEGQVHLEVPEGYDHPTVLKGSTNGLR